MSSVVELEEAILTCYGKLTGLLSACGINGRALYTFDMNVVKPFFVREAAMHSQLPYQIDQVFHKIHYYYLWCREDRPFGATRPQELPIIWWNQNQIMLWNLLMVYFSLRNTNISASLSSKWLVGFLFDNGEKISNAGIDTRVKSDAELKLLKLFDV